MSIKVPSIGVVVAGLGVALGISAVPANAASQVIYSDSLRNGWQSWSWATIDLNAKPAHSGKKSISVKDPKGWEALAVHHTLFSTNGYTALSFWAYGGKTAGQRFLLAATIGNKPIKQITAGPVPPGTWKHFVIPLSTLQAAGKSIDGFWIQNGTGKAMPVVDIDDISLK